MGVGLPIKLDRLGSTNNLSAYKTHHAMFLNIQFVRQTSNDERVPGLWSELIDPYSLYFDLTTKSEIIIRFLGAS